MTEPAWRAGRRSSLHDGADPRPRRLRLLHAFASRFRWLIDNEFRADKPPIPQPGTLAKVRELTAVQACSLGQAEPRSAR